MQHKKHKRSGAKKFDEQDKNHGKHAQTQNKDIIIHTRMTKITIIDCCTSQKKKILQTKIQKHNSSSHGNNETDEEHGQ